MKSKKYYVRKDGFVDFVTLNLHTEEEVNITARQVWTASVKVLLAIVCVWLMTAGMILACS